MQVYTINPEVQGAKTQAKARNMRENMDRNTGQHSAWKQRENVTKTHRPSTQGKGGIHNDTKGSRQMGHNITRAPPGALRSELLRVSLVKVCDERGI